MKKIIVFAWVVLLLGACGEKDLKFYPTFEESITIPVDNEVVSEFKGTILASDISNAIDDVLDQTDGEIESVNIEALWFVVKPLANNKVQKATCDVFIKSWTSGEYKQILEDYEIKVDKDLKQTPLNELMKDGVDELVAQLDAIAKGNESQDITFKIEDVVEVVELEGEEEKRVHVDVMVNVRGTVTFAQTVEML